MSPTNEPKLEYSKKRSKKVMTLIQKIEILDKLSAGQTPTSLGRLYNVNESTIRYIKKNEMHIRDSVKNSTPSNAKSTGLIRGRVLTRMEKALTDWLLDMRHQNISVDSNVIRGRALSLYDHFRKAEKNPEQRNHPFNASRGWYMNFKRRLQTPDANSDEYMFLKPLITVLPELEADPFQDISEHIHIINDLNYEEPQPLPLPIKQDSEIVHTNEVTIELETEDDSVEGEVKSDWTLDSMAEVISAVNTLTDLMDHYDPDLERSLAIRQSIESAVLPYSEIYRNLHINNLNDSI